MLRIHRKKVLMTVVIFLFIVCGVMTSCSTTQSSIDVESLPEEKIEEELFKAINPSLDDALYAIENPQKFIHFKTIAYQNVMGDDKTEVIGFYSIESAHIGGLDRVLVIILDDNLKAIGQGSFASDKTEFSWLESPNGKKYLLFSGTTINQGVETQRYEIWGEENREWKKLLS